MKLITKMIFGAALLFAANAVNAQATAVADNNTDNPNILPEAKPAEMKPGKEITLAVKNDCEKQVFVFAGNKKEVFEGKGQQLGGISNNTLYLREGDVICIMNNPKTIQACSVVKDGVSKVEINKSGNGFVK